MWAFAGEHPLLFAALFILVVAAIRGAVHEVCVTISHKTDQPVKRVSQGNTNRPSDYTYYNGKGNGEDGYHN